MRWVNTRGSLVLYHSYVYLIHVFFFATYQAMDYHQKALNIQKSGSGVAKASTAETCVLMGMVKSSMGEFKSALNVSTLL